MKKNILTLALSLMVVLPAFAQISTGEPNYSVIPRTGNRPVAGDWGVYIGGSVTQIMDLVEAIGDDERNAWGLPLTNFKYYVTDQWEARLGFQFACNSTKATTTSKEGAKGRANDSHNYTRFLPGVAYHFSNQNILDVYAGAQLPIGWNVDKTFAEGKYAGYTYSEKERTGTFVIGAGLFIGCQMFIADLPFAIGIEGGFSGMIEAGGVPKTTIVDEGTKQVYYNGDPNITKASRTEARWGADAAITFSYYFH